MKIITVKTFVFRGSEHLRITSLTGAFLILSLHLKHASLVFRDSLF